MNTADTKTNLNQAVRGAIQSRIDLAAKELVEQAKIDLEKKIPEIVASVLIDVIQMPQVEAGDTPLTPSLNLCEQHAKKRQIEL